MHTVHNTFSLLEHTVDKMRMANILQCVPNSARYHENEQHYNDLHFELKFKKIIDGALFMKPHRNSITTRCKLQQTVNL